MHYELPGSREEGPTWLATSSNRPLEPLADRTTADTSFKHVFLGFQKDFFHNFVSNLAYMSFILLQKIEELFGFFSTSPVLESLFVIRGRIVSLHDKNVNKNGSDCGPKQ